MIWQKLQLRLLCHGFVLQSVTIPSLPTMVLPYMAENFAEVNPCWTNSNYGLVARTWSA